MTLTVVTNNDDAGAKFADLLIERFNAQYKPGQFKPEVDILIEDGYPKADFVIEDAVRILAERGYDATPVRYNSSGCKAGNVTMRRFSVR